MKRLIVSDKMLETDDATDMPVRLRTHGAVYTRARRDCGTAGAASVDIIVCNIL